MWFTTRVRVVFAEEPERGLAGVRAVLFDRDESSADDPLGEAVTDRDGWAQFLFHADQFTDAEDPGAFLLSGLPDLYVVLYDQAGRAVFSSRQAFRKDAVPREFGVAAPRALLEQLG